MTDNGDVDGDYQIVPAASRAPAPYLGDRSLIAEIKRRITAMTQMPADTPDHVIWQFAQVCTAHQLNPFTGEVYIIELGKRKDGQTGRWEKQYAVHVGVKGLRKMARRQANYQMQSRRLDAEEVRQYRRSDYDVKDVGYEVEIYRLDVARECKDAGIAYLPTKGIGFWRAKARYDKYEKSWKSDIVPETWSPDQVAEKRAEVSALKKAFDIELAVGDPSYEGVAVIEDMEQRIESYDRDHALPVEKEVQYEEDGNVLFAPETTSRKVPAPPPSGESAPQQEERIPAPSDEQCQKFTEWARKKDRDPNSGPCSDEQYGYLAGVIDGISGQTTHKAVLSRLFGREISSESVPAFNVVSRLLDWLPETRGQNDEKEPNPDYNSAYAACIRKLLED